jgi:hypothetical protein
VRVGLIVLLGGFALADAQADPYVFYQVLNNNSQPVTFTEFESPADACASTMGNLWNTVPLQWVKTSAYVTATGQCVIRTEADAILVGTVVPISGSCPSDVRYDFELQACVNSANQEQIHAVALSAYLWMCLVGGMLVGFKAGQ